MVLLLVNAPTATAQPIERSELIIPGLLPIYRTGTDQLIGYGSVESVGEYGVTVKLFLDYSTPERLELETGVRKYLELRQERFAGWMGTEVEQYLTLTDKTPADERVLPVGAPELALY